VFNSTTSSLEFLLRRRFSQKLVALQGNAFPSVAFAARRAGCELTWVDIDHDKLSPSLDQVKEAYGREFFDVYVHQHTGGEMSLDWPPIRDWLRGEGVYVIEDASQAAGSWTRGGSGLHIRVEAGQLGDVAFFSTSATKALHTGQGSVMVTDDADLAEEMTRIRQYGRTQMFQAGEFVIEGGNISQSEMNAAVGNVLLDTMEDRIAHREAVTRAYVDALEAVDLAPVGGAGRPNRYKVAVVLPESVDRAKLKADLKELNVQLGSEVYDFVTPHLEVFGGRYTGRFPQSGAVPQTEAWAARHICLPVHNVVTIEEAKAAGALIAASIPLATREPIA
jgi:dTDP-4-amino-4,6-dideoxygalactose transaminase